MRGIIRPLRSVTNVVWCNGNTSDFGSDFLGSNPSATTTITYESRDNKRRF